MLKNLILAVKCAPSEDILRDAQKAGIEAAEIYLSEDILTEVKKVINICKGYSFRYAVHAPNRGYNLKELRELVEAIDAVVVVFHNNYWEDEWEEIAEVFKRNKARICVENTYSVHEPLKFMRKFNIGRCLDLEHLQMECLGVYEEEFLPVIREASHIHLTGYYYGSKLWHTHLHQSPQHSTYMLGLLKKAGYSGLVVSEAKVSLQNYAQFKKLNTFFKKWQGQ